MAGLVVDWETLASNFDNDKFAISLVVDAFLTGVDDSLLKVTQAVQARDPKAIAMSAHALKGAILNFGAKEAIRCAQDLESQGYDGLKADIDASYKALEDAVAGLILELKSETSRYQEAG
jgi:HPt (histidine-containing phosphotransfer) domain-containing protein